ncbi:MAG: hypothetical protein BWY45_02476 [Euryarchaeota archaeon ADurb.Bin294]|nr:MAG: hypothetical protein BWY45_02476 [Euryarchaeota archaeon ADurb.Bin294]
MSFPQDGNFPSIGTKIANEISGFCLIVLTVKSYATASLRGRIMITKKIWETKYTSPKDAVRVVGIHKITQEDILEHQKLSEKLRKKYGKYIH